MKTELAYDIEQLFIEGHSPKTISLILECPIGIVYEWLEDLNLVKDDEEYSPHNTLNS